MSGMFPKITLLSILIFTTPIMASDLSVWKSPSLVSPFCESVHLADAVFGNSAHAARAKKNQVVGYGSNDLFGYQSTAIASVFPLSWGSVSLGINTYGASDNPLTQRDAQTYQIVQVATFAHAYQTSLVGVNYFLSDTLQLSTKWRYLSQTLYNQHATGWALDISGVYWLIPHVWVGFSSDQWIQSGITWQASGLKETLPTTYRLECGIQDQWGWAMASNMGSAWQFSGAYLLHPSIGVTGKALYNNTHWQQIAIGTQLTLSPVMVTYQKKIFLPDNPLSEQETSQDQLGLLISW